MERSFLHASSDPPVGVVTGYRLEGGAAVPLDRGGASSVFSTVEDLQRWDENFYTGVVGGAAWARRIVTPGRLSDGTRIAYAFGNWVGSYRGLPVVQHSGSAAGYSTYLVRFPTRHLSVAVLCNVESARPLVIAHQLADLLLAGAFPERGGAAPRRDFGSATRWSGTYIDLVTGESRQVAAVDTNLRVTSYGDATFVPLSASRFRNGGTVELAFTAGRGGSATMRQRYPMGGENATFTRVPAWLPTASQLAEFAGTYANAALGATHEITMSAEGLLLQIPGERAPHKLQPLTKDVFGDPRLSMVRFVRGTDGRVTGYGVHMPRARGITFDRQGR
jgi:hypothetical protein